MWKHEISFLIFQLNQQNKAVPLIVAGGGGGIGIGKYVDDDVQQARAYGLENQDSSGQVQIDNYEIISAGPGGGWRGRESTALDPHFGAALLEGARGGIACYNTIGQHGFGGFGGGKKSKVHLFTSLQCWLLCVGGGGCDSGGGGGGYAGGDSMLNSTNGEGGTSYLGLTRSIPVLSFVYPGSNSGHGSVIIIPATDGCGCDYRCVALDEYRSQVACICPEGWRLKPENLTSCECKMIADKASSHVLKLICLAIPVIDESSPDNILVYLLIIITTVLAISLVFLFMMLCEY